MSSVAAPLGQFILWLQIPGSIISIKQVRALVCTMTNLVLDHSKIRIYRDAVCLDRLGALILDKLMEYHQTYTCLEIYDGKGAPPTRVWLWVTVCFFDPYNVLYIAEHGRTDRMRRRRA
jgi:hypothetical protein